MQSKIYQQKRSLNFYTHTEMYEKIEQRAIELAIQSGWSEEIPTDGKKPNKSGVVTELCEIGFEVIGLFGDVDWKDHLKVQAEPLWAKKIINLLENLETYSTDSQRSQAIQKVKEEIEMDMEGMIG